MAETQLAITAPESAARESLAPLPWTARIESHPAWPVLSQLPMTMTVRITLNRLKVSDLLRLEEGQILESTWSQIGDVPLVVGDVRLGWGEFEVLGQKIGVRVTQLA